MLGFSRSRSFRACCNDRRGDQDAELLERQVLCGWFRSDEVSTRTQVISDFTHNGTEAAAEQVSMNRISTTLVDGIGDARARQAIPVVSTDEIHPNWTSGGPSMWSSQGVEERFSLHAPDRLAGQRN